MQHQKKCSGEDMRMSIKPARRAVPLIVALGIKPE
jgi:hypothetical protein